MAKSKTRFYQEMAITAAKNKDFANVNYWYHKLYMMLVREELKKNAHARG